MSSTAQIEKDKGNASFRTGDFAQAVGHYSAAIIADRKDPTLPLNRAAAYLKLGKNDDAERDCTTSLSLREGQVKALFRRAQARIALQKVEEARDDLNQALKLEPKNDAVILELKRLEGLASSVKPSAKKPLDVNAEKQAAASTSPPRRRRVPIEIVEGKQHEPPSSSSSPNGKPATENLTPISSRKISSTKKTEENGLQGEKRSAPPSARAGGGGIFRASGENTVFPTKPTSPPLNITPSITSKSNGIPSNPPTNAPVTSSHREASSSKAHSPLTLFDFTSAWNRSENASVRWALLQSVPPAAIPTLFRTSLEAAMLVSALEVFSELLDPSTGTNSGDNLRDLVKEYLHHFAQVPRFSTILLFLTSSERNIAKKVCELVGGNIDGWNL